MVESQIVKEMDFNVKSGFMETTSHGRFSQRLLILEKQQVRFSNLSEISEEETLLSLCTENPDLKQLPLATKHEQWHSVPQIDLDMMLVIIQAPT